MVSPAVINLGELGPRGSSPWEKYLRQTWGYIGFQPDPGALGDTIADALEIENDPGVWVAYAASAMRRAWRALPKSVRGEAVDALGDVVRDNLEGLAPDLAESLGGAAEAAPIIGQLVSGAIRIIGDAADLSASLEDGKKRRAAAMKQNAQVRTLWNYAPPSAWVFQPMQSELAPWYGSGKKWRLRPCFRRASEQGDTVFRSTPGAAPTGNCARLLKCPTFFSATPPTFGCDYKGKGPNCISHTGISALFYPWWSPAYPPHPIAIAEPVRDAWYDGPPPEPNAVLIGRQAALLSDPASNLRVRQADLLAMLERFEAWWWTGAAGGLVAVDPDTGLAKATPAAERLKIVSKPEANHAPTSTRRDKFARQSDGLVDVQHATYNTDASDPLASRYGLELPGSYGLGATVEQYNAVVTMVRAFFSARAHIIRDGPLMRGQLEDGTLVVSEIDPAARAAVEYAAQRGVPLPSASTVGGSPGGAPPRAPTGAAAGGGGGLLGAAAVAALFLLR